jgi:predicted transposase YbfD/YdcC
MEANQVKIAVNIFSEIPDHRKNRGLNHSLVTIIVMALCAVMSGADTFVEIQAFGHTKRDWFRQFLEFKRVPDHETFRRVFARLNPIHFQHCILNWVRQAIGGKLEDGDIISIDGKSLRGTSAQEVKAIHMVNAWSHNQGLCLASTAVDGKSNEITALPNIIDTLSLLDLEGCIVTIDAMGTQREVARKLTDLNGSYILALKRNQLTLFEDTLEMFEDALRRPIAETELDRYVTTEHGHGREEKRECWVLPATPDLDDHMWPGLESVILVRSERTLKGVTTTEDRYFLSSLIKNAKQALEGVRTHWGVENKLHWVLDVAFNEDKNRTAKDHGAENLSVIRKLALNLIRMEGTKGSIAKIRKLLGWDDAYRSRVLLQLNSLST